MLILVRPDGPFTDQSGQRPFPLPRLFPLPAPYETGSFTAGVSQETTWKPAEGQGSRSSASAAPSKPPLAWLVLSRLRLPAADFGAPVKVLGQEKSSELWEGGWEKL